MENKKTCIKCKGYFEFEFFSKNKRSKDGLTSLCKKCKKEYDKAYVQKNKERISESRKVYAEKNKEKISDYQKKWKKENKEYLIKYAEKNKHKNSIKNKEYWEKNKESQKFKIAKWRKDNAEHIKEYRKNNKERDKKKAKEWYNTEKGKALSMTKTMRYRSRKKKLITDFSVVDWVDCVNHFNAECCYCGRQDNGTLHQEHFIPVKSGGPFIKSNIVPACISCNSSKSDKDFFAWYLKYEHYSKERELKILEYLGKTEPIK